MLLDDEPWATISIMERNLPSKFQPEQSKNANLITHPAYCSSPCRYKQGSSFTNPKKTYQPMFITKSFDQMRTKNATAKMWKKKRKSCQPKNNTTKTRKSPFWYGNLRIHHLRLSGEFLSGLIKGHRSAFIPYNFQYNFIFPSSQPTTDISSVVK